MTLLIGQRSSIRLETRKGNAIKNWFDNSPPHRPGTSYCVMISRGGIPSRHTDPPKPLKFTIVTASHLRAVEPRFTRSRNFAAAFSRTPTIGSTSQQMIYFLAISFSIYRTEICPIQV
jgi:hypothetical protein